MCLIPHVDGIQSAYPSVDRRSNIEYNVPDCG
jgi:hypothetical protein